MKTAYRLMDCPVNELDDLYIGMVEYQTFDPGDMVDHIEEMDEPEIDDLYSVNEYESDDSFFKITDGNYYRPTEFVAKFKGEVS